ncbi:MAG: non-homologous end-joining DNA ligase [Actinomycetota bacterium]
MILPRFEPMLATPWPAPFSDPAWWFEPKWDGIRGIIAWDGVTVSIRTRRGNEVADRYPELAINLPAPCVLDGEIVSFDETGAPSFQVLQNRRAGSGTASFVVFDLLWHDGETLVDCPFEDRVGRLAGLDLPASFRRSEPVAADGAALWEAIVKRDLEGLVAKRAGSLYRPGLRSPDWRKIHHEHTARALVGGFTPGEGGRSGTFASLLLGQWDGRALRWIGAVGTGFDEAALRAVRAALDQMRRPTSPFHPDREMPEASWVEPSLVAAVGYRNWTDAGRLRFPVFKGFTDDDRAAITVENEGPG